MTCTFLGRIVCSFWTFGLFKIWGKGLSYLIVYVKYLVSNNAEETIYFRYINLFRVSQKWPDIYTKKRLLQKKHSRNADRKNLDTNKNKQ